MQTSEEYGILRLHDTGRPPKRTDLETVTYAENFKNKTVLLLYFF